MSNSVLDIGAKLLSSLGINYEVTQFLGSGGQGEVYEVTAGRTHYALKWYHVHMATAEQKERVKYLVSKGAPDQRFLWPMDYIQEENTFGYIMPLRPSHYKNIVDLMKRKAEPSFKNLCRAGYELADCFQKLHSLGYSYCDLSFGNTFLDPDTGDILICDNDNVVVNGEQLMGVAGTLGFMAPEIVRGEAGPSTQTDLFSLAVLLFYMFMLHHPLEGAAEASIKCLDLRAKQRLYGENPVFIWSPEDASNRPIAGYQDNAIIYWRLYPGFIKNLFLESFTTGIKEPKARIVEQQWKRAFKELEDLIMYCPHCGMENFYGAQHLVGAQEICWCCNHTMEVNALLELGGKTIILSKDKVIYAHHLYQDLDFTEEIAGVVQHPKDPSKWGLKNLSNKPWLVVKASGEEMQVDPMRSLSLAVGLSIDFGKGKIGKIKRG